MPDYVFVYGTLRKAKDGSVHPYLAETVFLKNASLPGKLYQVGHYPGLLLDDANSGQRVRGEVYRLLRPKQQLKKLDDYEECAQHFPAPREYQRVSALATLADGEPIQVWVYVFRHSITGLKRISDGDYGRYLPASHLA